MYSILLQQIKLTDTEVKETTYFETGKKKKERKKESSIYTAFPKQSNYLLGDTPTNKWRRSPQIRVLPILPSLIK